jgi:S1-C subfamily serine protease
MVRTVLAGAGTGARIVRPWLGTSGQAVNNEIAQSIGLRRPVGVLVKEVASGSPGAEAGIRKGDVVLSVNGHEVEDDEALRYRIATLGVDQTARLAFWRDGRQSTIDVPLAAPPENPPRAITPVRGSNPLTGATVANLSPALADELGVELTAKGVIVLDVSRGTPAQRVGIQRGDVVLAINKKTAPNVEQLQKLLQAPAPWALTLKRGQRVLNVTVQG